MTMPVSLCSHASEVDSQHIIDLLPGVQPIDVEPSPGALVSSRKRSTLGAKQCQYGDRPGGLYTIFVFGVGGLGGASTLVVLVALVVLMALVVLASSTSSSSRTSSTSSASSHSSY
jgi:hypothetical protein